MTKKQNLSGVSRMISKYKKLLNEASCLYKKELYAEEAYKKAKQLRKEKEAFANKTIDSIKVLYEIDAVTLTCLLDSPTNSLIFCKKDTNQLFLKRVDGWFVDSQGWEIILSVEIIERLHSWEIFYIGDLIQKTSIEILNKWEGENVYNKVSPLLEELGLHFGIKITDWVKLPKPEIEIERRSASACKQRTTTMGELRKEYGFL